MIYSFVISLIIFIEGWNILDKEGHKEIKDQENGQKEDDDITIDFSKVAFWKKKKHDHKEHKEHQGNETEESPEADKTEKKEEKKQEFKDEKVYEKKEELKYEKHHKRREHKKEKAGDRNKESEDDIFFDVQGALNFLKKYAVVFLILIPIIFMFWFRSYPTNLPIADEWAANTVNSYYKNMIDQQVRQQYPNLPDANRNQLVEEQFLEFSKTNNAQIDQQIQQTAQSFKDQFKDENGYTYLADIDSYIWLRYARNLADYGYVGDELITGKEAEERTGIKGLNPEEAYNLDNHMVAPLGSITPPTMHPYAIALTYNIFRIFDQKMTFAQASFYVPIILSLFSIIFAFFIGRKVAGNVGGFFAAMIIAIHPFFLSRSYGSDTDVYSVFFPLAVVCLFLEALDAKDLKKSLILAGLAGIATGLFSFVWAFFYLFDFIVGAMVLYIIYYLVVHLRKKADAESKKERKIEKILSSREMKKVLLVLLMFIIFTAAIVTMFYDTKYFFSQTVAPIGFLSIKESTKPDLWPNVYTTVAELNEANWDSVIGSIGGKYLFLISLVGIGLTLLKKDEHGKTDMKYVFLFAIWYVATIYASFKGVRFVLLLVPAFAIGIGAAAGIGYTYLSEWFSKSFSINKKIVSASLFILFFIIIFISPGRLVMAAKDTSKNALPLVDDAWWETLTAIKENSSENAIINSWWDFGHHFKYIADRAVTFDGASQNVPQAHWIGKTLLTGDEEQAIAILRMLDCGANTGYEKIHEVIKDTDQAVDTTYKIISLSRESAGEYLKTKGFSEAQIADLLKRTHCSPPEDYFITSEDMIGKSGVWAHFGSWNFDKANIWVNTKGKSREETVKFILENTNYSKEEAEKIYFEISAMKDEREVNNWIAPWPSYASGPVGCTLIKNTTIVECGNGVKIDMETYDSFVPTQQGVRSLDALSYFEGDDMKERIGNNTMGIAGNIVQSGPETYTLFLMQAPLQKSIFHRLFYLNAKGLNHFDKLIERRSVTGQNIIVWKVNWEGKQQPASENKVDVADIPPPVITIS